MLCQECGKRPSNLHFTKIINGEKTEFHICEVCAREKGEMIPGTPNGFSIHNLLSGLLDFELSGSNIGSKPTALRCENCGITYAQFSKIGRFGCSACYDHFKDRLDPLFKRVHGNTTHVGKVPKRSGGLFKQKRELEQLKFELHQSIDREEFEKAAQIRDKIREIEKNISSS